MEFRKLSMDLIPSAIIEEGTVHLWKPRSFGSASALSFQTKPNLPHSNSARTEEEYVNFVDFLKDPAIAQTNAKEYSYSEQESSLTTNSFKSKIARSFSGMQKLLSFSKPSGSKSKGLKASDITLVLSSDSLSPSNPAHGRSAPDIKMVSSSQSLPEERLSVQSEPPSHINHQISSETSLKSFLKDNEPIARPIFIRDTRVYQPTYEYPPKSVSFPGYSSILDTPVAASEPVLFQSITESPIDLVMVEERPSNRPKVYEPEVTGSPSMFKLLSHSRTYKDIKKTKKERKSSLVDFPLLQRGLSRSLSREYENLKFETRRVDNLDHQRSHTRPIVETHRIYSKKDQRDAVISPTGQLEIAQGKVNQYHLFETIGTGAFGRVVLARDDVSGELFACKIISKMRLVKKWRYQSYQKTMDMIRKEVAVLKKVSNHPNVIKLYEVLDDSTEDNLYMFLEYCSSGPVMVISPGQPSIPLPEHTALNYFRDIVLGLEYRKSI
jgi:hypothetical protein